jgi:hypothetical protein
MRCLFLTARTTSSPQLLLRRPFSSKGTVREVVPGILLHYQMGDLFFYRFVQDLVIRSAKFPDSADVVSRHLSHSA